MANQPFILKAVSQRKEEGSCYFHPDVGEKASWRVHMDIVGEIDLCSAHYREFTRWECDTCQQTNYGMTWRCSSCGWVRPDTCRKCGEVSVLPLIKIVERREGHPCHSCGGCGTAKDIAPCPSCKGEVRGEEHQCFSCFGTGRNLLKEEDLCYSCGGTGKTVTICQTCKGVGDVFVRKEDEDCSSCNGTGVCKASSAQWTLVRIALTDIHPDHQEELKEYVDQYVCFKCANPDFSFIFCRKGEEEVRCEHYEQTPQGPKRCKNLVSRTNPSQFCYAHSKSHICEICGRKLKLDEWGRRCIDHRKCAHCDEKPSPGSIFCPNHANYKALGKILEEERVPETPVQILDAQERVQRAISSHARRRDRALQRAQDNVLRLRKMEQEVYEIVLRDPPQNDWRRREIELIHAKIGRSVDSAEITRLESSIRAIEREMDEAREFNDRVKIRRLRKQIQKAGQWIEEDTAVFIRYRQIGAEIQDLARRLEELRHYELWKTGEGEYRGCPIVEVEPYYILCKKCQTPFDARSTKWLCPYCTTAEVVPMAECGLPPPSPEKRKNKTREEKENIPHIPVIRNGRIIRRADDIVAIIHLPTDNRPELEHELNLTCEVCNMKVDRLKAARLYRPDKYVDGVASWRVYFACDGCRSEDVKGLILKEKRATQWAEERKQEWLKKEIARIEAKKLLEDWREKERTEFNRLLGIEVEEEKEESAPAPPRPPKLRESPSVESREQMSARFKEEAKEKRKREALRAQSKYDWLIHKDELTPEQRSEAYRLLQMLRSAKAEFGIEIPKRELNRPVPPPPPSQWLRK